MNLQQLSEYPRFSSGVLFPGLSRACSRFGAAVAVLLVLGCSGDAPQVAATAGTRANVGGAAAGAGGTGMGVAGTGTGVVAGTGTGVAGTAMGMPGTAPGSAGTVSPMGGTGASNPGSGVTPGMGSMCMDVPTLLKARCSMCHNAGAKGVSPNLMGGNYAASLPMDASGTCKGKGKYVDTANPTASLLLLKLTSTPPCGAPMPLGGMRLTDAEQMCVAMWIRAGTPNTWP